MKLISWDDFSAVELRTGRIVEVEDFPEARKPAYKIRCDFGPEVGIKRTSAQLTDHYTKEDLLGRLVLGVVNFPARQIGPVRSEFLLTGFADTQGKIVLAIPERDAPLGARLC